MKPAKIEEWIYRLEYSRYEQGLRRAPSKIKEKESRPAGGKAKDKFEQEEKKELALAKELQSNSKYKFVLIGKGKARPRTLHYRCLVTKFHRLLSDTEDFKSINSSFSKRAQITPIVLYEWKLFVTGELDECTYESVCRYRLEYILIYIKLCRKINSILNIEYSKRGVMRWVYELVGKKDKSNPDRDILAAQWLVDNCPQMPVLDKIILPQYPEMMGEVLAIDLERIRRKWSKKVKINKHKREIARRKAEREQKRIDRTAAQLEKERLAELKKQLKAQEKLTMQALRKELARQHQLEGARKAADKRMAKAAEVRTWSYDKQDEYHEAQCRDLCNRKIAKGEKPDPYYQAAGYNEPKKGRDHTKIHTIRLLPNNKQRTMLMKAFGAYRYAYNYGLRKYIEYRDAGQRKHTIAIRDEFFEEIKDNPMFADMPYVLFRSAFKNLDNAFTKFFADLRKGKNSFPKPKYKGCGRGCIELFNTDRISPYYKLDSTSQYIRIPNIGMIKLQEHVRFHGRIYSLSVTQRKDGIYASVMVDMNDEEYSETHHVLKPRNVSVGIDLGVKHLMTTSDGIRIAPYLPRKDMKRKGQRLQQALQRKQHDNRHGFPINYSQNFKKARMRLHKHESHICAKRRDFIEKLTTVIANHYRYVGMEKLDVIHMKDVARIAEALRDVSFYQLRKRIEQKVASRKGEVYLAPRFYKSTHICSACGTEHDHMEMDERVFVCHECGVILDRDQNAAINLRNIIGRDAPESKPADLLQFFTDLQRNGIGCSKIETGNSFDLLW